MTTDTGEQGLERLICIALTGDPCEPPKADGVREGRRSYGGVGWSAGSWLDYDREHCFDLAPLTAFMRDSQPDQAESPGQSHFRSIGCLRFEERDSEAVPEVIAALGV